MHVYFDGLTHCGLGMPLSNLDLVAATSCQQFTYMILLWCLLFFIQFHYHTITLLQNTHNRNRADSRLAPSQWETSLQSNAVSHWLGTNLESALRYPRNTRNGMRKSWHGNAFCITDHWSLVDSPHKGPVMQSFDVPFLVSMNKFLNTQFSCWWFVMPWYSHDVTIVMGWMPFARSNCVIYVLHLPVPSCMQCHVAVKPAI